MERKEKGEVGVCEKCGKVTYELFECDFCGRLICEDCGCAFQCDDCWEREQERKTPYWCN